VMLFLLRNSFIIFPRAIVTRSLLSLMLYKCNLLNIYNVIFQAEGTTKCFFSRYYFKI
jgi:hypothetical protein